MRAEVTALIFGPNLPPGGERGTVTVSSLGIEASVAALTQRASLKEITLREVGFGKRGLEIGWIDNGEAWAAHVLQPDDARRLLAVPALAAMKQASALAGKQRRNTAGRAVGWSILGLFVALPLIALALLFLNANRIADWIADNIPVEQEMEWGRQAFEGMRGALKIKDKGSAYDAVQTIGKKLTKDSKYKYEFHVADDKSLNAFAMPGGVIVVHTGLIEATKRPEELAGVLAHEVQHVELRHSIRGMIKELGLRGMWAFATGDVGGTLIGQAALELSSLKFSRDDESEADDKGFDALIDANIDPSGMPAIFKTMGEKAGDAPVGFISTHPLSEDREEALRQRVTALAGRNFAPLDMGVWPPLTSADGTSK